MRSPRLKWRWQVALVTLLVVAGMLLFALARIQIETDILESLPGNEPVLDDARYVLGHNPVLDRVLFDLEFVGPKTDPDRLVQAAEALRESLVKSDLFTSVGNQQAASGFGILLDEIVDNLPVLFSADELREQVDPLLTRDRLAVRFDEILADLAGLTGVGQGRFLSRDPLALRNLVLVRLAGLLPVRGARIYKGHVVSSDERHLLLTAGTVSKSSDTAFARRLDGVIQEAVSKMEARFSSGEAKLIILPVGAYRAALDNENLARSDAARAGLFIAAGIVLLLLLCFPRPWMGLLSFVPALAGTVAALFVYSLIRPSISLMAVGFGGAIVSITIDHGIAYLLFLDRDRPTGGREAAREVWSVGLLATLTTAGAFLALTLSGFPILEQLGIFAALGVTFSFLFVHTVFPAIFPVLPAASRKSLVPIGKLATSLALKGGTAAAVVAALLGVGLACLSRPVVEADFASLNTVTARTAAAEERIKEVWGDVTRNVFLMVEAGDSKSLQGHSDRLTGFLRNKMNSGEIKAGMTLSDVLPGGLRAAENLRAWKSFWSQEKVARFIKDWIELSVEKGFAGDAFDSFFKSIKAPTGGGLPVPVELEAMFGIRPGRGGKGLVALVPVTPGPAYQPGEFFEQVSQLGGVRMLDPNFFSARLSAAVVTAFSTMLWICAIGVVILLLLVFLELTLPLIVLTPILFSLVCTLGTLRLLGRPLDMSGLLLAIVVMGISIDYSLYFVRGQQRYLDPRHGFYATIRSAVLLASLSTLVGFGAMAFSDHALLESAGLTSLLAVGFSLVGTFVLLPPLLGRVFSMKPWGAAEENAGPGRLRRLVMRRFRHLESFVRQFARFKMILDPMFKRLCDLVGPAESVLDVGCGYGVPGAFLLARNPRMRIHGWEPDPHRVRIAERVYGDRGVVSLGAAPELPVEPEEVDLVLMLDMAHYLNDEQLSTTLAEVKNRLGADGRLLMRITVPGVDRIPMARRLDNLASRIARRPVPIYRPATVIRDSLERAGFKVVTEEASAPGREETWFLALPGA